MGELHEHEYGHELGHEHVHEHHHEHEQGHTEVLELAFAQVELEAHTHEQAATVSLHIHPREQALSFARTVELMQEFARSVEDAGGIVGHIKAFAKQGDTFTHASVTAADLAPTCEGDPQLELGMEADVRLAAIVLLISQDDLLAITKDAIQHL